MTQTVLVRAGSAAALGAALEGLGFLAIDGEPWRFSAGASLRWIGPEGTRVVWTDYSYLGRRGVQVIGGDDGVAAVLAAGFDPVDGVGLVRAWQAARGGTDAAATLAAFLDFAAWAALADPEESALLRTPVFQAALASEDPVLRLAAIRNLYVFTPDRAAALLAGRTDPDNPGWAMWRQHYVGLRGT